LYRLTPSDPEALSYSVEPVDNGLETVRRLSYSANNGTPNGTLYAVGSSIENRASVWKVRKSETGGGANTWVDDGASFSLKKGASSIATGVTADASGIAYTCGRAFDGPAPHWIVRRKISGGVWTTVHDLKGAGDTTAYGISVCAQGGNNPADAILAVGNLNNKWTVIRSQNQGASGTWQVVDSWSPDTRTSATATGVACDSSGNIYVVGARGTWDFPKGWVVRMSSQGGAPGSWTTVLDSAEGNASWAFAVAVDGDDNVWISGMTQDVAGTPRWTVLKNRISETWPASWAARQRPLGVTMSSKGRAIAADAFGNVFTAGEIMGTSPTYLGLVQLVPAQPTL
jgi:hypothetical protein